MGTGWGTSASLEQDAVWWNHDRHRERKRSDPEMKGQSGGSGSPRRSAPRDDGFVRLHLSLEAHLEAFRQPLKRLAQGGVLAPFGQHSLDLALSLADIE